MTRKDAKKLLPLIEAFANGAVIEWENMHGEWRTLESPSFRSNPDRYRIKPEPKIRYHYAFRSSFNGRTMISGMSFDSERTAEQLGKELKGNRFLRVVKLVEVD